ncbi:MAG: magnesium transporter CorA family protein [Acidimicrobiales bacterium]|jgi:magnesium transporter
MDRNRDLTDTAAAKPEPGASSGHIHRGLAQVDMGVPSALGGPGAPAAPPAPPAPDGQGARGIRTRLYRGGSLVKEDFPVDEISDHLEEDADCVVWLDLCAPDSDQLAIIGTEFGLHALAIEDALDETQRTKIDRYKTHLFMSAHSALLDAGSGELVSHEIAVFITPHALITVRKDPGFSIDPVVERWDGSDDLAHFGVSFLLYGLLDYLVDGHFRAVESLDEAVEATEDELFDNSRGAIENVQRKSFQLRKSLVLLRRITLPMREVVNSLLRQDLGIVPEPMAPYYRDIYDHVIRATEWTESLRDLVTTIVETNLTEQGNRMNLIMKKVTSWAAIIAVPTAITGWYGQNVPYPGFGRDSGEITSAVLIIVCAVVLYMVFRRKDWL